MESLSPNWFAEGTIDLEYKQYILLAYLARVQRSYTEAKLYPILSDLIFHYRNLCSYRDSKQALEDQFPQRVSGIDPTKMAWTFTPDVEEEQGPIQEIDSIVEYSIPQMERHVVAGTQLYEQIDGALALNPIGILPLYKDEGYVLIRQASRADIQVYQYAVSSFHQGAERLRGIHTAFVTTFTYSLVQGYEQMKLELIRTHKVLPNPATYAIESQLPVPMEESLLPVAKRRLLQAVAIES